MVLLMLLLLWGKCLRTALCASHVYAQLLNCNRKVMLQCIDGPAIRVFFSFHQRYLPTAHRCFEATMLQSSRVGNKMMMGGFDVHINCPIELKICNLLGGSGRRRKLLADAHTRAYSFIRGNDSNFYDRGESPSDCWLITHPWVAKFASPIGERGWCETTPPTMLQRW